jgi:hypothetical protein
MPVMDVEALSVAAVVKVIGLCPRLTSYIAQNDKTPFTDGHIEVYGGPAKNNSSRVGRVHVQVKGRTVKRLTGRKRIWSVERKNLLAYKKDSGVLYLVVDVEETTGRCIIYYAILSPFKIQNLLDAADSTSAKLSVPIKVLPDELAEVDAIVRLSLETRNQHPDDGFDPVLFGQADGITVGGLSGLDLDVPQKLDPGVDDITVTIHTVAGMTVHVPGVLEFLPADYSQRPIDFTIGSGGITYVEGMRQRLDPETLAISLPDGLTMTLKQGPKQRTINFAYGLEGSLAARLRAVRFLRGIDATQAVELNGSSVPLGVLTRVDTTSSLQVALDELTRWAEFFEMLHVDTEFVEPANIGEEEHQQLRAIRRAIVGGEEASGIAGGTGFVFQPLGPWGIVILLGHGESEGKWTLRDPFSSEYTRRLWAKPEYEDAEPHPVTPYEVVAESDRLPDMLNLRLGNIVDAYESIADFPDTTLPRANRMVLQLIRAADVREARRAEFLDAAMRLNAWLVSKEGPEIRHRINGWQIEHRTGGLTGSDLKSIRALKREISLCDSFELSREAEICCAILLGDSEETEFLAARLAPEELASMKAWPIWNLSSS